MSAYPPASSETPPPVPERPSESASQASSDQPLTSERERDDSPHPGFTAPDLHIDQDNDNDYVYAEERRGRSPPRETNNASPPRRRVTSENVPITSVGYARDPERVISYLIPLPIPTNQGRHMNVPQRYMIYTPPAPHLLKPDGKEGKRHKLKRLAQQEIRKAKTYEGKTLSIRGLHSKGLRGVDWALAAILNAEVTFLNRVPRKQVDELVLLHPASVLSEQTPEQTHAEFKAQLHRAQRKAAKHSIISLALFPPSLVIDTLAAVVWPFGGLAEIDAVWAYVSISGFLTARSVTKRLDQSSMSTEPPASALQREGQDDPFSEGRSDRRDSRQVHFEEILDDDAEKKRNKKTKKDSLKVRFVPDEAMNTMESYLLEACHRRNPRAFKSPGVPPTQTDVLASIGWWPDQRGKVPATDADRDWDDENWQTRQVKEDLDRVMKKAAKQWDKWCKSYGKYPERALGEKGHSIGSEVMRKLHIKKGLPLRRSKQEA